VIQCGGGAPVDTASYTFQNFAHVMLRLVV
jgi:hypothetical protein